MYPSKYIDYDFVVLVLSAAVLVLVIENTLKTSTITSTVRLRLTEHEHDVSLDSVPVSYTAELSAFSFQLAARTHDPRRARSSGYVIVSKLGFACTVRVIALTKQGCVRIHDLASAGLFLVWSASGCIDHTFNIACFAVLASPKTVRPRADGRAI